ncbi:uncharacterized protein LOC109858229 [Pseudomyrmex gracilis]|uniref:uncharacterized protein LOC109858229 n=1 Tax=Pseudomyrmex gracilis TaxID=219809 RepID=UPI0009950EF4|nr:uncharacterized protein LOC109858229 [Pseudomyrmex gracilis]
MLTLNAVVQTQMMLNALVAQIRQKVHKIVLADRKLKLREIAEERNKQEFLRRYVTMDEIWIHHFTLESNRQSAEWTAASERHPKQPKTQTSAGKVLASVFWDAQDLAPSDYWLFADKRILQGKKFGSNEEVIAETKAYFETKDKSFYKKGIELLEKRWNQCITLEGNYVDE